MDDAEFKAHVERCRRKEAAGERVLRWFAALMWVALVAAGLTMCVLGAA
jgi:hypothetical protein